MRRVVALLLVGLLVLASTGARAQVIIDDLRPVGMADSDLRQILERVTDGFFDPISAQFRGLRYVEINGQRHIVCGEVNGKNQFGGFVGFRNFYYDTKSGLYEIYNPNQTLAQLVFLRLWGYGCV